MKFAVFHGTDAEFDYFKSEFIGSSNGTAPINRTGFNFTSSRAVAATFGKHLVCAMVEISRPYLIDAKGQSYSTFKHVLNSKLGSMDKSKYDGIIIRNYADAGIYGDEIVSNHYIPFVVGQIRINRVDKYGAAPATLRGDNFAPRF